MNDTFPVELLLRLVADAAKRRHEAERHFREMLSTARAGGVSLHRIADAAELSASRVHAILGEEQNLMSRTITAHVDRPRLTTSEDDVLIIPAARLAFADYLNHNAYICQPRRSFRDVDRIGFYRRGQIERFFPRIRYRKLNVDFTRANVAALRATGAPLDAEVADLVQRILDDPNKGGHAPGPHQIFLLTSRDDPQTLQLERPILHRTFGRGTAFVQGQRYVSEEKLKRRPATTEDL